jgi:hypothetical protein
MTESTLLVKASAADCGLVLRCCFPAEPIASRRCERGLATGQEARCAIRLEPALRRPFIT